MKSTMDGFNQIAGVYDVLANLVFGKHIRRSQEHFLKMVIQQNKVLVLGGGSGWILESINTLAFKGEVWYIEASSEMIQLASERRLDFKVNFIHGTEENIPRDVVFDGVITNFYLDLFTDDNLPTILRKISSRITRGAVWIATDFARTNSRWHRFLLRTMYHFFRITAGIDAKALPQWEETLRSQRLVATAHAQFYNGFIRSVVLTYLPAT